ncbi:hypothetical protein [Sinomonas notoginsengisoli]|nr:hypothetical protein [Sinomonas notoginsengisoli]
MQSIVILILAVAVASTVAGVLAGAASCAARVRYRSSLDAAEAMF